MITQSQREAVDEQMFLKLRKWRKPELELVTTCNTINKWLSEKYFAEAPVWGYISPERWNGFYSWLYRNGLSSHDLTDTGFSNDYLPGE